MKPQIVLVDKNDEIIGYKARAEITRDDMYRISALWLTNSQGDILIAQRNSTKKNNPGKWGPAVVGTVEEGETYKMNMIKEAKEELGLTGLKLERGPKKFIDEGAHRFFCQYFLSDNDTAEADFQIQTEEVQAVRWITPDALKADTVAHPENYVPLFAENVAMLAG